MSDSIGGPQQEDTPAKNGAASPVGVWAVRKKLVVTHGATLPAICVKTGRPADQTIPVRFNWHPPLLIVTIFLGVVVYFVLAAVMNKSIKVNLPLCDEFVSKRKKRLMFANLALLFSIGLLVTGVVLIANHRAAGPTASMVYAFLLLSGTLGLLLFVVVRARIARVLQPIEITDELGHFLGAHPEFLSEVAEHPVEVP